MKITVKNRGQVVNPKDLRLFNLHGQQLEGRSFSGEFDSISVAESTLKNCTFNNIRCKSISLGGGIPQSVYQDCIFEGCTFRFFAVGNVRMIRCQFNNCDLDNMFALQMELIDCQFNNTKIRASVFQGRAYDGGPFKIDLGRTINEFYGNDFSTANLVDVDFRGGIELRQQKLPASDDYLYVPNTCNAAKALAALELPASNVELNKLRKGLKSVMDLHCSDGQKDQLVRVNFPPIFRKALAGPY